MNYSRSQAEETTPLVSIITPAYNQAAYIEETIRSILDQNYPRIEYIILDDGSTDNTADILKKYGENLIWETHANMGEALTVNKGFRMVQGDFVVVVNSDDILLPGAVDVAVAFMQSHPDILVGYPDWDIIDSESKVKGHREVQEFNYVHMVKHHYCQVGPGAFIRRRAFTIAGLRDPDFKYVGDYEYWLRLGLFGEFARIPATLAAWREHPVAASNSCKGEAMADEHVRVMMKYYTRPDIPVEIRCARHEALCRAHIDAALTCGFRARLMLKHLLIGFGYHPPAMLTNIYRLATKTAIRNSGHLV